MHYTRVYYWVSSWWANRIGLASLNCTPETRSLLMIMDEVTAKIGAELSCFSGNNFYIGPHVSTIGDHSTRKDDKGDRLSDGETTWTKTLANPCISIRSDLNSVLCFAPGSRGFKHFRSFYWYYDYAGNVSGN